MDKLQYLQCKYCGKVLRVLEDIKSGKCAYCGNEASVPDNMKSAEGSLPGEITSTVVNAATKSDKTAMEAESAAKIAPTGIPIRTVEPVPMPISVTARQKPKKSRDPNLTGLIVLGILVLICAGAAAAYIISNMEIYNEISAKKIGEWPYGNGETSGSLASKGLAISPDGQNIYISLLNQNKIEKYSKDGAYLTGWGTKGSGAGEFNEPSGMCVDSNGNIYVADAWNTRIQKFDPKGKFLSQVKDPHNAFYSPRKVAVNKDGLIFVVDTGLHRVRRFDTSGNSAGAVIGKWGHNNGEFQEPFGITFDSKGRVFIADAGNRRIQAFSGGMGYVGQFNGRGWPKKSGWPMIAMDSRDRLYVLSSGARELNVYDASRNIPKYIGTISKDIDGLELFENTADIAIDKDDNVYVIDTLKKHVIRIRPLFDKEEGIDLDSSETLRNEPLAGQSMAFGLKVVGREGVNNPGDILETADHGFLFTVGNRNDRNIRLIKIGADGSAVFDRSLRPAKGPCYASHFIKTGADEYVLTGGSDNGGLLMKVDGKGNVVWTKYDADSAGGEHLQPAADGGFIGSYSSKDKWLPYLVKTDESGKVIWKKKVSGSVARGGFLSADKGGYSYFASDAVQTTLIRMDINGNNLNTSRIDNFFIDMDTHSKHISGPEGYAILGNTKNQDGRIVMCLVFLDLDGKELGRKTYGKSRFNYSFGVIKTSDKGYMLLGCTHESQIPTDPKSVYLVKTDPAGNIQFEKTIGWGYECGTSIIETFDHNFMVIGQTYSFHKESNGKQKDVFLIKLDSKGNMM